MVEWGVGEVKVVAEWGILVDTVEELVEEEEKDWDHLVLTHWHVIDVGCVGIWPVTVPNSVTSRWEVAQAALPVEHSSNPGKKVHSVVEKRLASPVLWPQCFV